MLGARRLVHVINLHRMGFVSANDVQRRYSRYHLDELAGKSGGHGFNVILLAEHNPVYTAGQRVKSLSKHDENKLRGLGAEFHRSNRGGLITFHGPGQLVAYPILNLKYFQMGMRDYVCNLEKTMIQTCKYFGLQALTTSQSGIQVRDNEISSLGVHGSRNVTTHGVSLNCNTDLSWFDHIDPCGVENKGVTSLSKELGKDITINGTIPFFLAAFQEMFHCDIEDSFLQQQDKDILPTPENLERLEKWHDMELIQRQSEMDESRKNIQCASYN